MTIESPETCGSAVVCSDLLAVHTQKWKDVCEEVETKDPNNPAMLWVKGYVFGLSQAADMASRSRRRAGSAKPQCTPLLSGAKSDAANGPDQRPGERG